MIEPPASALGEGWYDTGDVVDVDQDGMVTISGRVKRFAKIAGEMVSLDVVEQVARAASPGHFHAAIVLVQERGTETTVLFTTDDALTRARLLGTAKKIGAHDLSAARKLLVVPEIPVLASGKTDYVGLKSLIENDTYKRLLSAATGHSADQLEGDAGDHFAVQINPVRTDSVNPDPASEQAPPFPGKSRLS